LAYPLGAGQPLGCRICTPSAEVLFLPTGTTARPGAFGALT
jgi:hypothetical protein